MSRVTYVLLQIFVATLAASTFVLAACDPMNGVDTPTQYPSNMYTVIRK